MLRQHVARNIKWEGLITSRVHVKHYFYHTERELFKSGLVTCMQTSIASNSGIVYQAIATKWPDKQTYIKNSIS